MKRLIIKMLLSKYSRALIYEALEESRDRKLKGEGETLQDQAHDIYMLKQQFKTKHKLY